MDISNKLQNLLNKQGWTRYKLAKQSGVPESTLTNIFYRGTTPTISTLEEICKTLNITLSQFFAEDNLIEMTDELKEFYDVWICLSYDKRKNILETMKMMK
ncbi:MAG: helix-turn-helix transcriptional regulator [Clostridia bacterium]|nr:helix-turn-helix transcriptional regulator [Clostridia bacterium]